MAKQSGKGIDVQATGQLIYCKGVSSSMKGHVFGYPGTYSPLH
ncbi:hypothetical protein VCSRO84_1890 [Vibrio cholerae]|nr:hypothetical protein VCSRO84_1890 [Vibrio cholerae]